MQGLRQHSSLALAVAAESLGMQEGKTPSSTSSTPTQPHPTMLNISLPLNSSGVSGNEYHFASMSPSSYTSATQMDECFIV